MTAEISLLAPGQTGPVIEALARAFHDDPLKLRLAPHPRRRQALLHWLLGGTVRYCARYGYGLVFADGHSGGAACWLAPGRTRLNSWGSLRAWGLVPGTLRAMAPAEILLSLRLQAYVEKQHQRLMPGPHWYLFLLGVSPERQGHGLGGRLMEPVLRRASGEGLPCYLETQTRRNVSFYEKHGFRVLHEGAPPGLGMPLWFMGRS